MDVRGYTPAGVIQRHNFTISSHDIVRVSALMGTSSPSGQAYPAANLAMYVPFFIDYDSVVYETWVLTGTLTTSNATEIGVYDTAGGRLFTTATTVAVASDLVNSSGMTDYTLPRGSYYLAFGCDGTRNFLASANTAGTYQSMGCMQQTGLTGANLPSTATFATYAQAQVVVFGLNLRPVAM